MRLLRSLFGVLLVLPELVHATPRAHSQVPVYRPQPPYHTYAEVKEELQLLLHAPAHADTMRMQVSDELTAGGEHLYLVQLAHWHKHARAEPVAARDEPSANMAPFIPPSTPRAPSRRLRVLFSFGEHAREHISVESGLHLLKWLLHGVADARSDCAVVGSDLELDTSSDAAPEAVQRSDGAVLSSSAGYRARLSSFLLDHAELHLLAVSNPDGKMYVERTGDFCWRNTGRNVDLNRNADWQFGKEGSSANPRAEEYHGTKPFSEAETRFIRDAQQRYKYDAYVSVHSGEQQLFVPFVDTESRRTRRTRPETAAELAVCDAVVRHPHLRGWLHDSGVGYERNDYSADGTLFDYMAGVEHVPRVFCVELYGGPTHDDCFVQFNPDAREQPWTDEQGRVRIYPLTGQARMRSPLHSALQRMHVFYSRLMIELIAEHYGITYVDPAENSDPTARTAALHQRQRICELENALYAQLRPAQPSQA